MPTAAANHRSEVQDLQLLTARQVAAILRVHSKTVYKWAAQGKLPCVRPQGLLRFMRHDINRWLLARKEG
jgi:excisionase family DNA binding protein